MPSPFSNSRCWTMSKANRLSVRSARAKTPSAGPSVRRPGGEAPRSQSGGGRRVADKRDARKREVAEAALEIIAREGVEGASLRAIAHALGCTTGSLTHYFRNKDDLVGFVLDEIALRLSSDLERLNGAALPAEALRRWIGELLPHNTATRRSWTVWLAFTTASLVQADLRKRQEARDSDLLAKLTETICAVLKNGGVTAATKDVTAEAELLLCVVDGLGLHAVVAPERFTARKQMQLLGMHLDGLSCRWNVVAG
jgi:AcrR family transcriptional regulator